MRYKFQAGSFAWVIQRTTGVILTLYIFLHLYILSSLKSPTTYLPALALMKSLPVRLAEAGLLGLVIAHALNGLRLTVIDLGVPTRLQKKLFYAVFVAGTLIFIAGSVPIISGGGQ